jgi:pyrimidine-nucleoside phosphorylase
MDQPLGYAIGNWLEVEESVRALQGEGPEDVMEVTHLLAGTMIYLGDQAESVHEGVQRSKQAVENGMAWKKWLDLVTEQGGDTGVMKNPDTYKSAAHIHEVKAVKTVIFRQ